MKYGEFGGQYVPQELKEKLNEIEDEFKKSKKDKLFIKEYKYYKQCCDVIYMSI